PALRGCVAVAGRGGAFGGAGADGGAAAHAAAAAGVGADCGGGAAAGGVGGPAAGGDDVGGGRREPDTPWAPPGGHQAALTCPAGMGAWGSAPGGGWRRWGVGPTPPRPRRRPRTRFPPHTPPKP